MAKRKTAPYVPHRFKRTMKVKNKKRKDLYVTKTLFYYWWLDENGKKHYGSTGFETASEADKAIADLIEKKSLGKPADEITLGEYAEPFFVEGKCPILTDLKDMKKDYSPDFARWTHNQIEKHIINDDIGKELLAGLTPQTIQTWLNSLPKKYGFLALRKIILF